MQRHNSKNLKYHLRSWLAGAIGTLSVAASLQAAPGANPAEKAAEPVIRIEDVSLFYGIYDTANGRPTAEQLQRDYLDVGSEGLHVFARLRNINGTRIAEAIEKRPHIYASARGCVEALPQVRPRLMDALQKLAHLYPEARFPPVTIAVGRGKPVGIGAQETGVQIGLEALCAIDFLNPNLEDRFVYVITHEFIHVQQVPEFVNRENLTVLENSLQEGAAEFVAELIAGSVAYSNLQASTKGRELEIETAFAADKDKTDLSDWLYNGTSDDPGDLGYWVGYRIVKSYYQHAYDKHQALRDIFEMTDAQAFLAKSGWRPGIKLN